MSTHILLARNPKDIMYLHRESNPCQWPCSWPLGAFSSEEIDTVAEAILQRDRFDRSWQTLTLRMRAVEKRSRATTTRMRRASLSPKMTAKKGESEEDTRKPKMWENLEESRRLTRHEAEEWTARERSRGADQANECHGSRRPWYRLAYYRA